MSMPPHLLEESRALNWLAVHRDWWGTLFEQISMSIYMSVINAGDTVADCGVNIGDHTMAMARCCTAKGRVYAFEAAPAMMAHARGRIGDLPSVEWVERALWNVSGEEMTFHVYPDANGLSSLRARSDRGPAEPVTVLTTTLDDAIAEPVSLMKLDIEGAEFHALTGAARVMREGYPVIVFENGREDSCQRFGYTRDAFFDLFYSRGYQLYSIVGVPFTPEMWEDVVIPWQFLAIHPGSPRGARTLHAAQQALFALQAGVTPIQADLQRYL